jgi:hypothetical protein
VRVVVELLRLGDRLVADRLRLALGVRTQRRHLLLRLGDQALGCRRRLGRARLQEVAGLGVLLVGPRLSAREQRLGLLVCLVAQRLRGGHRLVVGPLTLRDEVGGGTLCLGHDLVVVGLCGLHQDLRLLACVADDLLGVAGGVVEESLGVVTGPAGLGVDLLGLQAQAPRLPGVSLCLLLGAGLEFVGHPLGMPHQGRGAFAAVDLRGRTDGTVLHGGHVRILPNER